MKLPDESLMTEWFSSEVKPYRYGVYLVKPYAGQQTFIYFHGGTWMLELRAGQHLPMSHKNFESWRGLTEEGYKEMCKCQ